MTDELALPSEGFLLELQEMVRWWRQQLRVTPLRPSARNVSGPDMAVVALLEDIDSGDAGKAAVLRPVYTTERQFLDLRGEPDGDTTWRVNFTPEGGSQEQTDTLPANATAGEVQAALEALPSIGAGAVRVTLGRHTRDGAADGIERTLRRWIVEFTGEYKGSVELLDPEILTGNNLSFTTSETTVLADTGITIDVRAVIPVGQPTPLKASAIGVALRIGEFGWTLVAVECRAINGFY